MAETKNKLDLPCETQHYDLRIAGHTHVQGKIKLGILKHKNGNILKPLLSGDLRSERELSFYRDVSENYESDPDLCGLISFVPAFYGTWDTIINDTDIKYLCIEDVCGTFEKPSVLDVKIGAITYDPYASEEKIKKDTCKYPSVKIFKFRILGIKVYDHCQKTYTTTSKAFGISLTTHEAVNAGLGRFFKNRLGQINCLLLSAFLHKLLQLRSWFEKQHKLVFISSSILFVYEGNLSPWVQWIEKRNLHLTNKEFCLQKIENDQRNVITLHNSDCIPVFANSSSYQNSERSDVCKDCNSPKHICTDLQENCSLFRISMIDFAHVFPSSEEDSNYIMGLNSLISHMRELLTSTIQTYL